MDRIGGFISYFPILSPDMNKSALPVHRFTDTDRSFHFFDFCIHF